MPNITEYIQYSWFEQIWISDIANPDDESLGRWLGPASHAGSGHISHILTQKGHVITRASLCPIVCRLQSTLMKLTLMLFDADC